MRAAARTTGEPGRPVLAPRATVSTVGFVGIVLGLISIGLAGVMVVSTSVGAQSRDLTRLRREATHLSYERAALESQLQRRSSANSIALSASQLGMVPNPYPAFINLADGTVSGDPTPVTGNELPYLHGQATAPEPKPTPEPITPVDPDPQEPVTAAAGDTAADATTADTPAETADSPAEGA